MSRSHKLRITSRDSQVVSHTSWVTSHQSWVTSHESQVTCHESLVTSHKLWITSHKSWIMNQKSWGHYQLWSINIARSILMVLYQSHSESFFKENLGRPWFELEALLPNANYCCGRLSGKMLNNNNNKTHFVDNLCCLPLGTPSWDWLWGPW